jgi:hypothetical protein
MDSALETALEADGPLVFWAIEIAADGFTLRLLDGSGVVSLGGHTFLGEDPNYGTWDGPPEFGDGITSDAPTLACTLRPPSDAVAVALLDALPQGTAVNIYFGALNRSTGALIGYDNRGEFEVDVAILAAGKNVSGIGLDLVSIWERFFEVDEGLGLTDGAWQSIYSGEKAFEYVSVVQRQLPWGSDGPRASVITNTPTGPGAAGPNPFVGIDVTGLSGILGAFLRR